MDAFGPVRSFGIEVGGPVFAIHGLVQDDRRALRLMHVGTGLSLLC